MMEEITPEEALARLFRLGIIVSLISVLHMLTLLLPWYVIDSSPFLKSYFLGYLSTESLIFSLIGGVLAGLSLLISTFLSSLNKVRLVMAIMTFIGAALMLISPFYLLMVKIPALGVQGKLEWGFFPSVITPIAMLAVGFLIVKPGFSGVAEYEHYTLPPPSPTPVVRTYTPPTSPASPVASAGIARGAAARLIPADEVEPGTICSICYYEIDENSDAVKCSSCNMVLHRDCAESWVNLNGVCPNPNCQRPITL